MRISDWSSDVCSSDLTAEEEPADAETTTEDGETTDSTEPTTETTDTTVAEVQPGDTECPPAHGAERTSDFDGPFADRSEEGRVGNECARTCGPGWVRDPSKKKQNIQHNQTI